MTIPGNLLDLIHSMPNYGGVDPSVPSPSAAQLPVDPSQVQRPGIWDRVQNSLMPVPQGFEGLLSDDDVKHARRLGLLNFGLSMLDNAHGAPGQNAPSLGQAFARSVHGGLDAYNQGVNGDLQQRMAGQQIRQQQLILANRMRVAQQYGPQPNETPEQTSQRLRQMYLEYLRVGDTDMAGKLGEVVSKLFDQKDKPVEHVDLGNRTAILDPATGRVLHYETNGPKPKSAEEVSSQDRFNATQTNSILDDYRTDTKQYHAALDGYKVLKGALTNTSLATPFAVLDAYARVVNPGAAVRQGTMAVLQEMGSYDQKVRRWLEMTTQGQWPPDMVSSIKGTIDAIMNEHHKEFSDARRRAVLRGQTMGLSIEPLLDRDEQAFGNDVPSAGGAPASGPTSQRYKVTPTR